MMGKPYLYGTKSRFVLLWGIFLRPHYFLAWHLRNCPSGTLDRRFVTCLYVISVIIDEDTIISLQIYVIGSIYWYIYSQFPCLNCVRSLCCFCGYFRRRDFY